nr:ribosomal protein L23 [Pyropia sp. Myanmar_A]BED43380.1 ribosomal protein L23 [Pyropia sp. Myanmar_B]BED43577.1 ribosomal protein L23 [Pyropia sp. Myanmar_C]
MDSIESRGLLDLVKYPIITDKTTKLLEENQYCFAVDFKATKTNIKAAIQYIFNVQVTGVNTCHPPKKKRNVGRFVGKQPHYKKAIVTLASKDSINLFSET